MRVSVTAAVCAALAASLSALPARAGIPECGNLRLEDVGKCEVRGSVSCDAGCSSPTVFKKACATKLHTVCREDCSFSANAGCTDSCTEQCTADCDRGVNVICTHNCFGECVGSCDANCAGIENEANCHATCEATCDGECDIKCRPLVDGSCYKHCIECCGGSCTAAANLECQTSCQEEQFEDCEYELELDCNATCDGDGAIFCDDQFVLGGRAIPACAAALVERGLAKLDVNARGQIDIDTNGTESKAEGAAQSKLSCSAADGSRGGTGWGAAIAMLGVALAYRRRR